MEKHIIQFLVDALISSETQINTIDKQFNTEFGGHIGKQLASITRCLKLSFYNGDICLNSHHKMIDQIAKIILENSHSYIVFKMIAEFFTTFSKRLKKTDVHSTSESFLTQSDNLSETKHCDKSFSNTSHIESCEDNCITISDNEEDFETISSSHKNNEKETKLLYGLRSTLDEININFEKNDDLKVVSNKQECKNSYHEYICKGFTETMDMGIKAFEKPSGFYHNEIMDFTTFTNTIEKIASINFNEEFDMVDDKHNHIRKNGCINPIVQILATSLRAILEAIKFHN